MTPGRIVGTVVAYAAVIAIVGFVWLCLRLFLKPQIDWFVFGVLDPYTAGVAGYVAILLLTGINAYLWGYSRGSRHRG